MLYQEFTVAGVINETTLHAGLTSLVEVPVHVNAIIINCDTSEGNVVECWIGNKRVVSIYDYNLDTQEQSAADTPPFSSVKIGRLPVDLDVPAGQIFRVGVRCGAVANDLFGAYEYTEKE